MKYRFDERQLSALEALLEGESLAAKKAKLYSVTLLDPALTDCMAHLAKRHAARFAQLFAFLGEKGGEADE